ncbi:CcmD family protein [Eisenibacter elegans]|jgi:hypothetical protein|uniref:CcmD family protein n=1 Tax=Eisenibacter elegans TaxID=997 RepID=UPI0003F96608|nr:hypothetical protein [Eisenibacter elegans]
MYTKHKIYTLLAALLLFVSAPTKLVAQTKLDSLMVSDGKLYVVAAVFALVMIGFFGYLIQIDRKLRRLEREAED